MSDDVAPTPRATYRLQLRSGVTFRDAESLIPYLAELGVSHVYCSPYVEARSGSTHGYDIVDPTRIDPTLGGEAAFEAFVAALRAHGMGHVLDWVPNHVGIALGENAWWQDVLEFGAASAYADFFEIDWQPARPELHGKVLLPVLGRHYGDVLESGELEPEWDPTEGLRVRYHEHRFPISPTSSARFLRARLLGPDRSVEVSAQARETLNERLLPLRRPLRGARSARQAATRKRALVELVAREPTLGKAVDEAVRSLRGQDGSPASFDALHQLLEQQHYRLAYWRVAAEEVNYRRFFDIDELAALQMDRPEVFERTHARLLEWIEAGWIDGLRIDHVDGLADPRGYCARLRERVARPSLYLVLEKILGTDEKLREDWPVDGTTGYEFLNQLNGLFVDPRGATPLDRLSRRFTGDPRDFDEILDASKRRVMRTLLAGELESLASRLDHIAQADRWTRDYTRSALRDALEEIVACFPVYRSYVDERGASPDDRRWIEAAVNEARRRSVDPDSGLFEWIGRVLTGDLLAGASGARHGQLLRFVTRFQQYTAPVMAKGLEDTSFYRSHRLTSLNEVGGDPRRFGVTPQAFHAANCERAARWPRTLLCTASHDTKRGEDARARIDVISELPAVYAKCVRAWARENRRFKRSVSGAPAPSSKDEYLLYQVLLGTWPTEDLDADGLSDYRERVQGYMQKALREAKERSSWRHPDVDYEKATADFVAALLSPDSAFLESFRPFQTEVAERGALNGLAAVVLKLSAPGVPDIYQGSELWDLSLADPDNRRPVDFEARRSALSSLEGELDGLDATQRAAFLRELLRSWRDGRIKLFLTWQLLAQRRMRPDLFVGTAYLPLSTRGAHARRLIAFARRHGDDALLVIAPRLAGNLPHAEVPFPLGRESWGDSAVVLPKSVPIGPWRDIFTGRILHADGHGVPMAECLSELPASVLCLAR